MRKILSILFMLSILFFTNNVGASTSPSERDVKSVLKSVSPSIVKVVAENHKRYIATGVALKPDYVISSTRVIRFPYKEIYVRTVKGKEYEAKVVGKDRESSLILLKIEKKALTPFKQAKSFDVGDWIALVGVFYKKFPSIYQGIVSSVSDEDLILNAPVMPGSLGGAVVNNKGELMGVICGRFGFVVSPDYIYKDHSSEFIIQPFRSRNKDLCYAIPVSKVMEFATDLEKYGKIKRGWLGVTLDYSTKKGTVKIGSVTRNSPAAKAGILKGDKILKIGKESARTGTGVSRIIKSLKPGHKAKIELLRDDLKKSVIVVIGELKDRFSWTYSYSPDIEKFTIPELTKTLPQVEKFIVSFTTSSRNLGIDLMALTPELAEQFNVKEGRGLMISKVYENSAAYKAGFKAADIIVKVNGNVIKQSTDLKRVVDELEDDESVVVDIYRKGKLKKLEVVPDKGHSEIINIADMVKDKLKDIYIKVDDENRVTIEEVKRMRKEREKLHKLSERYSKESKEIEMKKLKQYKKEMEKMKKEQEKLRKEMEKMRELLEEKEKEKKK